MQNFIVRSVLCLALLALAGGCTKKPSGPEVWIYTSFYNHVVQDLDARLKKKFPNVEFHWYQSGSENVATKVNTELLNGKTQADIIMSSDLFWYEDLKAKKALMAYDSPAVAKVPAVFRDPDHTWAVSRMATMVIAYNSDIYNEATAPKSFADLTLPKFKDKVAMGSPLESGTTFTTVAVLAKKLGWDYFQKLRANGALSAGGNTAVIGRIETKERPVGIVLLENILAIRRKNPKIVPVYPQEGSVMIPGPVALTSSARNPELDKQIYDFFFSPEAADAMLKGDIYSIFADAPALPGARPFGQALSESVPWTTELIHNIRDERDALKKQFSKIMIE